MPSPIINATIQSTALAGVSNVLAQMFDAWNKQIPLEFSFLQLLRFVVMNIIVCPPNYLWQAWLERTFPGWKATSRLNTADSPTSIHLNHRSPDSDEPTSAAALLDPDIEKDISNAGSEKKVLDWRNTFLKWFIDCMTIGALGNTVLFFVIMGILKGQGMGEISQHVRTETLPLIVKSYTIWPVASVVNFTLIPVERRIVFLSAVGLCWGVLLSLVAARV